MKVSSHSRPKPYLWTLVVIALVFLPGCKGLESISKIPESTSSVVAHEGFWRAKSAIMAGMQYDEGVIRSITVKIEDDQYESKVGSVIDRGKCIVDQAHTPKRMIITGTDGPNNGRTFLAVYEMVDEDTLRICYDFSGKQYPDTFEANKENRFYTATYQRETPVSDESR